MSCCSSAARGLPRPFHRLTQPSSALSSTIAKARTSALPPAFLAPRIHAQSFYTQPPRSASASPSKNTSSNSAQNLRGTLRRLGQSSKWDSKAPAKAADSEQRDHRDTTKRNGTSRDGARTISHRSSPRSSSSGSKSALSIDERKHHFGFRDRANELLNYINKVGSDLERRIKSSRVSPVQIDTDINNLLDHFEREMKVLRVMIKTKDVLVDPDNAWKSASRIKAPYNAALRLCLQRGRLERAFKLFNSMKKDGIFPSAATYTVIINGLNRHLIEQRKGSPTEQSPEFWLRRKEAQRIREVYPDIERLWKQAFPRYFQRAMVIPGPQSTDILTLDGDDFHRMSEQARRNLVSQQASIKEIREHPKMFSHTIGTYLHYLRIVDQKDELAQLYDRLFPTSLIDTMAKGLEPNASPQEKLELANRKLSDWLPLGDVSTFSAFFTLKGDSTHPERVATVERIWSRLGKLMDIELYERQTATQSRNNQRKQHKATGGKAGNRNEAAHHAVPDEPRFVPDDFLMADIFSNLQKELNDASINDIRLGLDIASRVYGLDLISAADGIIRPPQTNENDGFSGLRRYMTADVVALDGPPQPVAELRDTRVTSILFRMLNGRGLGNQRIALFNYLWAKGFADQQAAESHNDAVGRATPDTGVFGKTLRPPFALSVLWDLCEAGDPVSARVVLEAMKRTAQAAPSAPSSGRKKVNRRASHTNQNEAEDWTPSDLSYLRVMRANLTALLDDDGPGVLTAKVSERDSSNLADPVEKQHKHDVWTEAKSLFAEWCEQKKADGDSPQSSSRWTSRDVEANHHASRSGRKDGYVPDALSRIHKDNMLSLLLHIAKICAARRKGKGSQVAREALELLHDKLGLVAVVEDAERLRDDLVESSKKGEDRGHKVRSLDFLSQVIDLALDTSDHSFAPKANVELWKQVKKMLPSSNVSAEKDRDARKPSSGSNRLLLSRDDYRELEAEAEAEAAEEDDFEKDEDGQGPRGYRMQRRSRHVEQELERWVRGAAS